MNMEKWQLIALIASVFIWYYASILSATSSQSYVESLRQLHGQEDGIALAMMVVTFLQMISGVVLGSVLGMLILKMRRENPAEAFLRTTRRFQELRVDNVTPTYYYPKACRCTTSLLLFSILFPGLHAAGSLFTNLGYACSTASFVQMIKLTEPIQTLTLDFILRKLWGIPLQKINVSVSCFIVGTFLVFYSRNNTNYDNEQATFWAVMTVLLSGFFLSSRNVTKKIIHYRKSNFTLDIRSAKPLSSPSSIAITLMEGIGDFIYISLGGILLLLPVILFPLAALYPKLRGKETMLQTFIPSMLPFCLMVLTHSIYNLASMMVLSFVAAPVHSLLNSGKRLSSTLFAMIWFAEDVTTATILGFILIFAGVTPLSSKFHRFLLLSTLVAFGMYNSTRQLEEAGLIPSKVDFSHRFAASISDNLQQDCKVQFKNEYMRLCYYHPDGGNFEAALGPAVVLKLLESKFRCSIDEVPIVNLAAQGRDPNITCLFTLGSIFHMVESGDHVWGTGIHPDNRHFPPPENVVIYAVRGPNTETVVKKIFGKKRRLGHGDPGFLISTLYPLHRIEHQESLRQETAGLNNPQSFLIQQQSRASVMPRICFVARSQDLQYSRFLPLPPENIISSNYSWRAVVESIRPCDYVASSSLHGIIAADTIGVPSLWFQFPPKITNETEETFTYYDYFQTVGRSYKSPISNSDQVLDPNSYDPIMPKRKREGLAKKLIASFPYQLFTTTAHMKSNRTLVIIIGTLRGGEEAWTSMYQNLLKPNFADLALLVPKNTSRSSSSLFEHAKFVWEHNEYDDWGVGIDETIGGSNATGWRHIAIPQNSSIDTYGLFGGVEKVPGSGAIIFLLRVFLQEKLRREALIEQYDRFVLTRSDHYYGCTHNLDNLDNRFMWVPGGEDYLGVTDRHLVCNSFHILKALNILPPVVLNPERYRNFKGNPESLIKLRWQEEGLWNSVRSFPRLMFTCASRNDTSRWKQPDFSSMVPEGVFLKYKKEYNRTKETCAGTRNYFTGESCVVCNSVL